MNRCDADTLDGCLHFVCKFDCRVERTLTLGDLDNQNLKRRSAINQRSFTHPHLYLATKIDRSVNLDKVVFNAS